MDAETVKTAQLLRQFKLQCKLFQESLPTAIDRKMKHFDPFISEINDVCKAYEEKVYTLAAKECTAKHVPLLIGGLKVEKTSIQISCLRRLDAYLQQIEDQEKQSIYTSDINPLLIQFAASGNHKLQSASLAVLHKLNNVLDLNKMGESNLNKALLKMLGTKNHANKVSAVRFMCDYVKDNQKRRDELFRFGISAPLLKLLRLKGEFDLLTESLILTKNLCKPHGNNLPMKKYTNQIVKQLNLLLLLDDDTILERIFDVYGVLIEDNNNVRTFHWDNISKTCFTFKEVQSKLLRATKRDKKSLKKSIKIMERYYELDIPFVIRAQIIQFASKFDETMVKNMNVTLPERIKSLFDAECGERVNSSTLLTFIKSASRFNVNAWGWSLSSRPNVSLLMKLVASCTSMDRMKVLLRSPQTEMNAYELMLKFFHLPGGVEKLMQFGFYEMIITPISRMFLVESDKQMDVERFMDIATAVGRYRDGRNNTHFTPITEHTMGRTKARKLFRTYFEAFIRSQNANFIDAVKRRITWNYMQNTMDAIEHSMSEGNQLATEFRQRMQSIGAQNRGIRASTSGFMWGSRR